MPSTLHPGIRKDVVELIDIRLAVQPNKINNEKCHFGSVIQRSYYILYTDVTLQIRKNYHCLSDLKLLIIFNLVLKIFIVGTKLNSR